VSTSRQEKKELAQSLPMLEKGRRHPDRKYTGEVRHAEGRVAGEWWENLLRWRGSVPPCRERERQGEKKENLTVKEKSLLKGRKAGRRDEELPLEKEKDIAHSEKLLRFFSKAARAPEKKGRDTRREAARGAGNALAYTPLKKRRGAAVRRTGGRLANKEKKNRHVRPTRKEKKKRGFTSMCICRTKKDVLHADTAKNPKASAKKEKKDAVSDLADGVIEKERDDKRRKRLPDGSRPRRRRGKRSPEKRKRLEPPLR